MTKPKIVIEKFNLEKKLKDIGATSEEFIKFSKFTEKYIRRVCAGTGPVTSKVMAEYREFKKEKLQCQK